MCLGSIVNLKIMQDFSGPLPVGGAASAKDRAFGSSQ